MLGSPIVYLKGMRILMFQLSGFYYTETPKSRDAASVEAFARELANDPGMAWGRV